MTADRDLRIAILGHLDRLPEDHTVQPPALATALGLTGEQVNALLLAAATREEVETLADGSIKIHPRLKGQFSYYRPNTAPTRVSLTSSRNNPWVSGSFYLFAVVVVICALRLVFGHLHPLFLPVVLVGGIITLVFIGAFQLRNDDQLREEPFLTLIFKTFEQLPLLGPSMYVRLLLAVGLAVLTIFSAIRFFATYDPEVVLVYRMGYGALSVISLGIAVWLIIPMRGAT